MKKVLLPAISLFFVVLYIFAGCGYNKDEVMPIMEEEEKPVVGFSQLGAESDWRIANTTSMIQTFEGDETYDFLFEDAQQKQANQITAVRNFIQQDAKYIVIAPVMETGWDTVLSEVQDAGITVVIVDRMVDVSDSTLFTCWVGSDFNLEGKKVTEWLHQYATAKGIDESSIHIADIQGTSGSSSQIGRTDGLMQAVNAYGWDLLETVDGDYTAAKAYEEMTYLLGKYDNLNVVYCENDNEAFGAIDAIEDAGRTVGLDIENGDIMILSFDGVNKDALKYVLEGKIACIGECNPLHGPRVKSIIDLLENGHNPDRYYYVDEQIFSADDTVKSVNITGNEYKVTLITAEYLEDVLDEDKQSMD